MFLERVKSAFVLVVETVFSKYPLWLFLPYLFIENFIGMGSGWRHNPFSKSESHQTEDNGGDGDGNGNAKCMDSHGFQGKNFAMMVHKSQSNDATKKDNNRDQLFYYQRGFEQKVFCCQSETFLGLDEIIDPFKKIYKQINCHQGG